MISIIGIPSDINSSYMYGAALAPPLIRKALHCDSSNLWTENGVNLGEDSILQDKGDIDIQPNGKIFEKIKNCLSDILNKSNTPIILGGDHSITYPVISAVHNFFPHINILHFDAHPDLYDSLQDNRLSHAAPFARIMENKLTDRLVQIGIRGMNGHQKQQAKKFGVEIIEMNSIQADIQLKFDAPLYISFDIDALDPAFAPGVSHFEPGGLSTRQAINLIHSIQAPKIIGCDIVEYNPKRDPSGVTAMTCAKILKEIAGKIIRG